MHLQVHKTAIYFIFRSNVPTENLKCRNEKAPEVFSPNESTPNQTETYDKKCDVYSLAMVMYALLTGKSSPYEGKLNNNQVLINMIPNKKKFRPPLKHRKVKEAKDNNHSWYIELMKNCWLSSRKLSMYHSKD